MFCKNCGKNFNYEQISKSNSNKNKKLFIFISLIIFIIFFLVYIFIPIHGKNKIQLYQIKSEAVKNINTYLNNKYGFTAEVISARNKIEDDNELGTWFGEYTDFVNLRMKYKGKKFNAWISGEKGNYHGYDDYQFDQIKKDLVEEITSKINLNPYKVTLYLDSNNPNNNSINQYYNGVNIEEFVSDVHFNVMIEYINENNLEFIKDNNLLGYTDDILIELINYNSYDAYKSMHEEYNLPKDIYGIMEKNTENGNVESSLLSYTDGTGKKYIYYKDGKSIKKAY